MSDDPKQPDDGAADTVYDDDSKRSDSLAELGDELDQAEVEEEQIADEEDIDRL